MGFFSAIGSAVSAVGNAISSACETFCNGMSLVVDTLIGVGRAIGEGIKSICDKIGTEGIMMIGSIALSLIIPGFGIPEILTMVQIVAKISEILKIGNQDSPEELGQKIEMAEKKPDDFDSTEAYIKYLEEEIELDEEKSKNLSPEEKAKYGLMGAALEIKAIQEKYHVELSPSFLADVARMQMSGEEVGMYVKKFSDLGITKMQDMTDYLRGNPIDTDKRKVSSSMMDTMRELYPELSEEQIEDKLDEMEDTINQLEQ